MAPLWIVGMMGAGKSTAGRLAAERLKRPFVDLDEEVAAAAGRSVAEVFAAEGEAAFRRRERAAVVAAAGTDAVVATGGGAVCDRDNRAVMRSSGRVVWLQAPLDELEERVGAGQGRPLLAGGSQERLEVLLETRRAAYEAAAHHRIDTAGRSPVEVAEEVVRWWSESG